MLGWARQWAARVIAAALAMHTSDLTAKPSDGAQTLADTCFAAHRCPLLCAWGTPRMTTVVDLFRNAFDPETVKTLCEAYDKACKQLHDTGQPYLVSEVIAQRIIATAKRGERDPERLCEVALKALPRQTNVISKLGR
jgi:hypothetical protein